MENIKYLNIIKQGIKVWNQWRDQNPDIKPDLRDADLSLESLSGANLNETNLMRANLKGANLSKAKLIAANLFDANLSKTYLVKANLNDANLVRADLTDADLYQADLSGANLSGANLSGADLREACLSEANLFGADLFRANLDGADLFKAKLIEANLFDANLCETDLREADLRDTNLTRADLIGADLSQAILNKTILDQANLINCRIYGISAWNIQLNDAKQSGLIITPKDEVTIMMDDLKAAQLTSLLIENEKIRHALTIVSSRIVLIMNRFSPEHDAIFNAIREKLQDYDYQPVSFDINQINSSNFIKAFFTLVSIAQFIIINLTDTDPLPAELPQLISNIAIPIKPIQKKGSENDLQLSRIRKKSQFILETFCYKNTNDLLSAFKENVIDPAETARIYKYIE